MVSTLQWGGHEKKRCQCTAPLGTSNDISVQIPPPSFFLRDTRIQKQTEAQRTKTFFPKNCHNHRFYKVLPSDGNLQICVKYDKKNFIPGFPDDLVMRHEQTLLMHL